MKNLIHKKLSDSFATLKTVMADDDLLAAVADAAEVTGNTMINGFKLMLAET